MNRKKLYILSYFKKHSYRSGIKCLKKFVKELEDENNNNT